MVIENRFRNTLYERNELRRKLRKEVEDEYDNSLYENNLTLKK